MLRRATLFCQTVCRFASAGKKTFTRHTWESNHGYTAHPLQGRAGSVPSRDFYPDVGRLSKKVFMSASALAWPYTTVSSWSSRSAGPTGRGTVAGRHTATQASARIVAARRNTDTARGLSFRKNTEDDCRRMVMGAHALAETYFEGTPISRDRESHIRCMTRSMPTVHCHP